MSRHVTDRELKGLSVSLSAAGGLSSTTRWTRRAGLVTSASGASAAPILIPQVSATLGRLYPRVRELSEVYDELLTVVQSDDFCRTGLVTSRAIAARP